MSEIDFLVSIDRIILSASVLIRKRIEYLRCIPAESTDEQERAIVQKIAIKLEKEL